MLQLSPYFCKVMKKITADWVFPVDSAPVREGVIICDDAGKILSVEQRNQHNIGTMEVLNGVLVPGFVNTHCHLELSHMKGKVDTGTGLLPFITNVVTKRNAEQELIQDAIRRAELEMLEGGIVAVGDISNTADTFAAKSHGQLRYHTFIELFDFLQESGTQKALDDWSAVYAQLELAQGSTKSMTPHAPYSVSPALFAAINALNGSSGGTVSIHNQETPPENQLFLEKKGDFIDFYGRFGISLDAFEATGQTSIFYALQHLNPYQRTLFVHNTLTTREEVAAAGEWSQHVYWATCPNANLYIENRMPDYAAFMATNARMTIGTDSLTSNWQLSILEEMKTIARYQSYVPFETILRWATLNGAEALGFDDTLGSIQHGKRPGILLLTGMDEGWKLHAGVTVRRII